jgi:predicted acyl esterase
MYKEGNFVFGDGLNRQQSRPTMETGSQQSRNYGSLDRIPKLQQTSQSSLRQLLRGSSGEHETANEYEKYKRDKLQKIQERMNGSSTLLKIPKKQLLA